MTFDLPKPFAYGREADVYELPHGRVLRRYRDGGDATREAGVMAHVARFGYPVPAVHEASGADLVMDRVSGPTMAEAAMAGTLTMPEAAEILAELLTRLHEIPPSVPRAGRSIVHGDLHPENVLITAAGPVVIDWHGSGDGVPDLDTALTALIIAQVAVGSMAHPVGPAAGVLLDRFLQVAPGDPVRLLDDAVAVRSGQSTLSADEISGLSVAAARVRGVR